MVLPHSLCGFSLVYCAEAAQLALSFLSRGSVLNMGVYAVCSWGGPSSAPSSASILDPLPVSVSVKWRSIQASAAHSQGDLFLNVPVHLKMKQGPAAFAFVQ